MKTRDFNVGHYGSCTVKRYIIGHIIAFIKIFQFIMDED